MSGEKTGKITIRATLLPESWRTKRARIGEAAGSGGSADSRRRGVNENEGFSILRNSREVHYGHIPHFSPVLRERDRWWGCEIEFDSVLDHWFSVKNIKIGARPLKDLRKELQRQFQGHINRFRSEIEKTFTKYEKETKSGPTESHTALEDIVKPITSIIATTKTQEDVDKFLQTKAQELFPEDEENQKNYVESLQDPSKPFKIIPDYNARADGFFIDIVPNLGKKIIHYNMNHPFFSKVYALIKKLENTDDDISVDELREIKTALKDDIDKLLYAYAEGVYDIDDHELKQTISDTLEELMTKWSLHLRRVYKS